MSENNSTNGDYPTADDFVFDFNFSGDYPTEEDYDYNFDSLTNGDYSYEFDFDDDDLINGDYPTAEDYSYDFSGIGNFLGNENSAFTGESNPFGGGNFVPSFITDNLNN